jgi:hypothetical protein
MKKLVIATLLFSVAVFETTAQQNEKQEIPDEQIIVNKKFDEHGNLIEYDSTYIHQWSVDTTFHFGFPGDSMFYFRNFPGIERFMNEFWNDSVFGKRFFTPQPFSFGFRFSPFGNDDLGNRNEPDLPDSPFQFEFPYRFDSLFFDFGFGPNKSPGFDHDFYEDFEERLNRHYFRFRDENFAFPGFKNEEHRQEWEQLMEKHRRELEDLQKKWDENKSPGKNL